MAKDATAAPGPDLEQGIEADSLEDGDMLTGHVGDEPVLLARRGAEVFAVSATCTHYGGPLGQGLLAGDTVHCPWHHACFDLRTGAPSAPALDPVQCWRVERAGDRLRVVSRAAESPRHTARTGPGAIVIVGGGAAGHAAAEMLRRLGAGGSLTMLSADPDPPCDRPNLSKDYLAGQAPEDWIPLRPPEFFTQHRIELVQGAQVSSLDLAARRVHLERGDSYPFDALLLATGAEPVRLPLPGADLPHVHTLRSLADSRAIIAALPATRRAVVLGAGFIGLEVAASLRTRGIEVDVVDPGRAPLEHAIGRDLGRLVRTIHEEHGVRFHLGRRPARIEPTAVVLDSGGPLEADLVVVGVGVRPRVELAERAGLAVEGGIVVDEYLATSAAGVFAAGDVARWPDRRTGHGIRVEHWVVAQRQGQIAARNILGQRTPCRLAPFFWSRHYDLSIRVTGHADRWDEVQVQGSIDARDCLVAFRRGGVVLAVATVGRDLASLRAEAALEADDQAALAALARTG